MFNIHKYSPSYRVSLRYPWVTRREIFKNVYEDIYEKKKKSACPHPCNSTFLITVTYILAYVWKLLRGLHFKYKSPGWYPDFHETALSRNISNEYKPEFGYCGSVHWGQDVIRSNVIQAWKSRSPVLPIYI